MEPSPPLVLFSSPHPLKGEIRFIKNLTRAFPIEFHLRRPGLGVDQYKAVLEGLPEAIVGRTLIHEHPQLADRFPLRGIHFNKRNPIPEKEHTLDSYGEHLVLSCSVHDPEAIANLSGRFHRIYLSPIFSSISKEGLKGRAGEEGFIEGAINKARERGFSIMALGGITPENIREVFQMGFNGAALMGSVWKAFEEEGSRKARSIVEQCMDGLNE